MEHEEYMRQALELARLAMAEGEVPVGCVIVRDGAVVGRGRNRRETAQTALGHAELEAIAQACRTLGGWRLAGCALYVTLEPCPMCAGAIVNARIPAVYYGAKDDKAGCCGSVLNLFEERFNHHPRIYGRVLEAVLSLLTPRQQLYLYLYYGEWLSLREIGRLLRVDHASVLRSIRCGLERLGTLAVGTRAEVRGLEELEERLMAHFNQLEPPEEALRPRHKAPARAPNPRREPARKLTLQGAGGAAGAGRGGPRTAELGGGACAGQRGGRWGSGRLLAALEEWLGRRSVEGADWRERSRAAESNRQKLGRLLLKLFEWIRRELHADNHRD